MKIMISPDTMSRIAAVVTSSSTGAGRRVVTPV
jgi:hypothetical protein